MWQHSDGRLTPVRCGASNRCRYCAGLAAIEIVAVVGLDSQESRPRAGLTLTTVDPKTPPDVFRRGVEEVFRRVIRREQPGAQYAGIIEFTTGKGTRSGGYRRPHQHALVKGVEAGAAAELEAPIRDKWREHTGATQVEFRELRTVAGATAYLFAHHHKEEQAPPKGWRGRRLRTSQDYWSRPIAHLRREARELLSDKRTAAAVKGLLEEWAQEDPELLEPDVYDDQLRAMIERRETADPPRLVRVARLPAEFDVDGLPSAWELQVLGQVHEDG